ncbi:acyltransferase [Luteibacter sp.]|uniref:acyltransferase family protein n=1 Tax=Luteibacter sp. TaxID=1886636 RepID=UPI002F42B91F
MSIRYRNVQGLRAIAALMVFCSHLFWDIVPMRAHWARPFVTAYGRSGVDIFFVISGFIIYHAAKRSAAQVEIVGRGRAACEFAMKRVIRIYPLYWTVFAAAAIIMVWAPLPVSMPRQPQFDLLILIDSIPNFRVPAAWTLAFEVYFYAMTAISILIFPSRIFTGLHIWFAVIAGVILVSTISGVPAPLDYTFAPILLEFLLGVGVGFLIDRGEHRLPVTALCIGVVCFAAGNHHLDPYAGGAAMSYLARLVCWGFPGALIVYGVIALEVRGSWIMPRALQYLGDASYSLYLWHAVVFYGVAALFVHFGWVGVVKSTLLTLIMAAIGFGIGLLSYHFIEKPSLRVLGGLLVSRKPDPSASAADPSLT